MMAVMIDMAQENVVEDCIEENPLTGREIVRYAPSRSLEELIKTCQHKHIWYTESSVFTTLRGIAVTCGGTSVIKVSDRLDDAEKLVTFAHEIAHVVLGHTKHTSISYLRDRNPHRVHLLDDADKEREATIWAAHLLVAPDVYRQSLDEAHTRGFWGSDALEQAMRETAARLGITKEVVRVWVEHQDYTFPVSPAQWLQQP